MTSLEAAFDTFGRATRFLGRGMRSDTPGPAIDGPHRAKVIGNGLRELDRFLNLLIDEVAAIMALPGIDLWHLTRQRNTANKLRKIRGALALPSPDHARLRAIGRSRDCLFHCAGVVRTSARRGGSGMMAGWPAIGEPLVVDAADLADLCGFYRRVARDLLVDTRAY